MKQSRNSFELQREILFRDGLDFNPCCHPPISRRGHTVCRCPRRDRWLTLRFPGSANDDLGQTPFSWKQCNLLLAPPI